MCGAHSYNSLLLQWLQENGIPGHLHVLDHLMQTGPMSKAQQAKYKKINQLTVKASILPNATAGN